MTWPALLLLQWYTTPGTGTVDGRMYNAPVRALQCNATQYLKYFHRNSVGILVDRIVPIPGCWRNRNSNAQKSQPTHTYTTHVTLKHSDSDSALACTEKYKSTHPSKSDRLCGQIQIQARGGFRRLSCHLFVHALNHVELAPQSTLPFRL